MTIEVTLTYTVTKVIALSRNAYQSATYFQGVYKRTLEREGYEIESMDSPIIREVAEKTGASC